MKHKYKIRKHITFTIHYGDIEFWEVFDNKKKAKAFVKKCEKDDKKKSSFVLG